MAIGMEIHLTRQATVSPAVISVQKPIGPGFFSIKVAISKPTKVANIAMPVAKAKAARPKDGN